MTVLVTGGTGTVGSQVVRTLLERGAAVQVLTRNPEKSSSVARGATVVAGNLLEPPT
ncbi:MAG: SDR family NAD(P)-dependent oxidoreductase, partial [Acidobacteriota bacterium]|nr:SDR family NAD(P)-dependent oxidoreductase [Acidobacteriota bacterium]